MSTHLACGGGQSSTTTPSTEKTMVADESAISATAPVQAPPIRDFSRRDLAYISAKADFILHVHWPKVQGSELYSVFEKAFKELYSGSIDTLAKQCGIFPLERLSTLVFAFAGTPTPQSTEIVLAGNGSKEEIESCLRKVGEQVFESSYVINGKEIWAYWPEAGTVVLGDKLGANPKLRLEEGSAEGNSEIMGLVKATTAASAIWGVWKKSTVGIPNLIPGVNSPEEVQFSIDLSSGFGLRAEIGFASPNDASSLQGMFLMAKPTAPEPMKGMLDTLDLKVEGARVKVQWNLSAQQISELAKDFDK